jgi:hypothetical protein
VVLPVSPQSRQPFEPGASPFRAKGLVCIQLFEWIDRNVEGGREAALAAVPAATAEYFRRPLLAGSWIDVFALVEVTAASALLAHRSHIEMLREVAREQCERDIGLFVGFLLKLASPESVMARLPRAATTYFDFVRADVEQLGPKHYKTTGHGIPVIAMHPYQAVTEAFIVKVLMLAGAKNVKHRWLPPTPTGYQHGVPIVDIARELSWE